MIIVVVVVVVIGLSIINIIVFLIYNLNLVNRGRNIIADIIVEMSGIIVGFSSSFGILFLCSVSRVVCL